ncbi:MAG: EVE domain-containing protein [Chitinophagaceae bacterium]|nr:MAG: EVE domain-containing protein [Chitinophagaceae bacterium]
MAYWLIKSEPFKYSWDQFVKDKKTTWDGVRNYAARNNLRDMKKGDLAFFYHSNEGLEIVGIAKVVKEAYQDPSTTDPAWLAVDFAPHKKLKKPVTLVRMKADPFLQNMSLIRLSRLSVGSITEAEWNHVLGLSDSE